MKSPRSTTFLIAAALSVLSQNCQPARPSRSQVPANSSPNTPTRVDRDSMVLVKGGEYLMGAADGMEYEAPVHEVTVKSFWIDQHEVTVAEFAKFVAATGYKTDAEKFGWSGAFAIKSGQSEEHTSELQSPYVISYAA